MSKREQSFPDQVFLGIEAGATHTLAAASNSIPGDVPRPIEFGPANLRLLSDKELIRHFVTIAKAMPKPVALAIGMAGARTETDRKRICQAAEKIWPGIPCYATSDLETALMADSDQR